MSGPSLLEELSLLAQRPLRAALGAMLQRLAASERLPAAELERQQRARLTALLQHARRTVPFYARHPERFEELPLLTRRDLQEHAEALESREVAPAHAAVRSAHTSGSTGAPVTVKLGRAQEHLLQALTLRDHGWHQRDLTLTAAALRADPQLGTVTRWSLHPRGGRLLSLPVDTPLDEQLAWLQRAAPSYVVTYANNALGLVERAEALGVALPGLRELGTFGEVLPPDLRRRAREVWGAPVVDAYSCCELGFIALQCPEHEHYHVQAENVWVELLREDGSPCAVGETGRVVVTPLHAFAMPLLRYDLGDYATRGGPCPTGLGLPVLERVVGRSRHLITLPSGQRLWPRFGSNVLGKLAPLRQLRLVQHSLERFVLEVVAPPLGAELEARVLGAAEELLGGEVTLTLEYRDEIPRSASGKYEDCVSLLPAHHSQ